MEERSCHQCRALFSVDDYDQAFYASLAFRFGGATVEIPAPTLCPDCRLQRRLSFRNQTFVARQRSTTTDELLFSQFVRPPPFPLISVKEWYDESGWCPEQYGQEVDFSRPFFDQFEELSNTVPRLAVINVQTENSDFCNNSDNLRNCYFVFDAGRVEDSLYCEMASDCRTCIECTLISYCELCYDCTSCVRCYGLQSSEDCADCSESYFLRGCRSCKSCFGCVNLRHKEFYIFNKQVTAEEYKQYIATLHLDFFSAREDIHQRTLAFWNRSPRPHLSGSRLERCTGNHLHSCKDVRDSFLVRDSESMRYCFNIQTAGKSCQDYYCWGEGAELIYECTVTGGGAFHCAYCDSCWYGVADLLYCQLCHGSKSCFGCISAQKRSHCILNKQYSKDAYDKLALKLVEHMRETGEWGQYFPMRLSAHPYNISLAQRYFPLTYHEVRRQGLLWWEEDIKEFPGAINASELPEGLPDSDDSITVRSAESQQPFRITTQEIKSYRKFGVPLPRTTYRERMEGRTKLVGKLKLVQRRCEKTGQQVLTAYDDESRVRIFAKDVFEREFE